MTRIDEIKALCDKATAGELLPCPFCGGLPVKGLTQKTGCQLHGDPIQYITVSCKNNKCQSKPVVKGIVCRYDGDDKPNNHFNATMSAIHAWNTRANSKLVPELLELIKTMADLLQDVFDPIPCDCYTECVGECRTKEKLEIIIEEKRAIATNALAIFDKFNEVKS